MNGRLCLLAVAMAIMAAVSASAGYATVHTYYGPEYYAYYGYAHESGYNWPTTNRVYRPLWRYFSIWYTDDVSAWGFKRNYWDNPLVWPYAGGYARSVCAHSDNEIQDPQYPVTCQYIA